MKLILTTEVDNLGAAGDIVEVKAGYGRNYLLPRGYAIVATRGAEKQVEGIRRAQEARSVRDLDHAREIKTELEALDDLQISVRSSDAGKLFGSVTPQDIVDAVKAKNSRSLDKRAISFPKGHVKSTGKYTADVALTPEVTAHVKFKVVPA